MDYDLLAQFDHPGVDPAMQQQAAALLSQPPVYPQYAPSPQTQATYSQPNYSDPIAMSNNNQTAQDAWNAAVAMQQAGPQATIQPYLDTSPGQTMPQAVAIGGRADRGQGYNRIAQYEDGSAAFWPGVGAMVKGAPYGYANNDPAMRDIGYTDMAGNLIPEEEFQRRMAEYQNARFQRDLWRAGTQYSNYLRTLPPAFQNPTPGMFSPGVNLNPYQVIDRRPRR